jgi:hypothetical protein
METVTGATAGASSAPLAPPGRIEETPPFWAPSNPEWPVLPTRGGRRPRQPRQPAFGLAALIVLCFVATFVAWVSAEPLWLAVGHGDRGTATVTRCSAKGVPYQCAAFTAASGRYVVENVALLGTDRDHRPKQGTSIPAEMVSQGSSRAYAADALALNLRSGVGLGLVLLCGLGIAWATGASRLDDRRSRRRALLACVGAPLLLTLAFLATAW